MPKKPAAKTKPAGKVIKRAARPASPIATQVAQQIVAAASAQQAATAAFEVLSPFKFRGSIVKPPSWIELSDDEAKPYQDAGVLGTEPGEVPESDAGPDESAGSTSEGAGA